MTQKTIERAFGAGQISELLYGRTALAKYSQGCAKALNFICLAQGPAMNRAGFQYVLATKYGSTKTSVLIPFSYNAEQTYALEFGDGYIRFHTQTSTLLEAALSVTAMAAGTPGTFTVAAHGYATGDWVYLLDPNGGTLDSRFFIVQVIDANTFSLTDLFDAAITLDAAQAAEAGLTVARVYEIASPYAEADLADIHWTQSADVMTLTHPTYQQRELKRLGATSWSINTITFAPTLAAPTGVSATPTGSGTTTDYYVVTALAENTLEESSESAQVSCDNDLTTSGNYNTIAWGAVSGAVRYNVYKLTNGLLGYIGQTDQLSFKDNYITADQTHTPPISSDPFSGAGNYPAGTTYFGQRRWFGGTTNLPETVWGTRSGTESNLSYTIPSTDADAITARMAAREANAIRHLVPLDDLLILTAGALIRVTTANTDLITPTSFGYKSQAHIGANNVQPLLANASMLYCQAQGGRVRESLYTWQRNGYVSNDVCLLVPDLFDGYTLVSAALMKAPHQIGWFVRSDGVLLGLTYEPAQEVIAWHQHDTDGTFESVCCIAEGNADALYAIVNRTVNGQTVRYVERMHDRTLDATQPLEKAFIVDSGVGYDGAAISTVGGLHHLEGKTVSILGDGAVQPQQVVANGEVTLQQAASIIAVGLPITADLQTLPLLYNTLSEGLGTIKNINRAIIRVYQSSGLFAGPSFDKLREKKQRTTENYGSPPSIQNSTQSLTVDGNWSTDGQICVRQIYPLPLTVVAAVLETATGG